MRVTNQITFTAKDESEAFRLASERLGRDAVILSMSVVKEGGVLGLFQRSVLRVTAGILEDDTPKPQPPKRQNNFASTSSTISTMDDDTRRENLIAFQKLLEIKERGSLAPSSSASPLPPATDLGDEGYITENVKISPEGLRNAYGLTTKPAPLVQNQENETTIPTPRRIDIQPQPQPVQAPSESNQNMSNDDARILKEQVGVLADRIDFLLQRLTAVETMNANNINMSGAARSQGFQAGIVPPSENAEIEERLRASEVDEKYIRKLLADYSILKSKDRNRKFSFIKWLASRIECAGDNGGDAFGGQKVMLIGPTGVGKTTTIAKLAAIKKLWYSENILLITCDNFRIGAIEQLKTFARILGIPFEAIFDNMSIQDAVARHDNSDIILLDTAGRSQLDKTGMDLYVNIYEDFKPDAVHLVLAANMKYADMLDVVEHIPNIPISHLLFTKLDETLNYGSIFNIQQVMGCPISFLTVGQNVPKDIETAEGIRIASLLMKPDEERKKIATAMAKSMAKSKEERKIKK
ncbi:MAG: flagellar biosynthesis protein FlhF [Synergistaceae bacterium]|nr:flagellar biosynthesis protein FlhF [Synergistaceae bacterium]